jgi:alkaline phosphatase D
MRCALRSSSVSCVLVGASALLAFCGSAIGGAVASPLPNGVAAGDATNTSIVLWARAGVTGSLTFTLASDSAFTNIVDSQAVAVADVLVPAKVSFGSLTPGARYYYRASDAAGSTSSGTFRTVPASGVNGFRMGVTGDWRGEMIPFPAVKNVPSRNLDLWVALGDTIYGDVDSPAVPFDCATLTDFRLKHNEVMTERAGLNSLPAARASAAMLAMIDDHEVTNDFAGGAAPSTDPRFAAFAGAYINETEFFLNGIGAFHEYHPINAEVYGATGDPRTAGKTKLYRSRTYGQDAAVIITDARSFRDTELPEANPLDQNSVLAFLVGAFNPARTMLGQAQLQDVFSDLLAAQAAGVKWKFLMVPEPTQNFGVFAASDRYEGYAAERTALLRFIYQNDITNVVFVTADIHGTLVNNLTYENGPGFPKVKVPAFEISTGSVSYDAPFGPTVAFAAFSLGLPGTVPVATYLGFPALQQEAYIQALTNGLLSPLGYDPVGLQGSGILSTQLVGTSTATNSYGWTEFDVDATTQALTITTYGVPYYPKSTVQANPAAIAALNPTVIQQFRVTPQPPTCRGDTNGDRAVNTRDLVEVLGNFGQAVLDGTRGDITRNGFVDMHDLTALLGNFGVSCP